MEYNIITSVGGVGWSLATQRGFSRPSTFRTKRVKDTLQGKFVGRKKETLSYNPNPVTNHRTLTCYNTIGLAVKEVRVLGRLGYNKSRILHNAPV